MRLVTDPGWILTKNSIMSKAVGIMSDLSELYREIWASATAPGDRASPGASKPSASTPSAPSPAPPLISPGNPKISRGENYRGLPWVMLDYPRVWGREDILAIRTMFLWGHGFSVTLHLKGRYKTLYLPVITGRRGELAAAGFHASVSDDEWRHEHTPEIFTPIDDAAPSLWPSRDFLKLSAAVDLNRWSEAQKALAALFTVLVSMVKDGY